MKLVFTNDRIYRLCLVVLFLWFGTTAFAQSVRVKAELTSGLTSSPVQGGQTNVVIFGFQIEKDGNPTELESVTVTFTTDPSVRFSQARLYRSTDLVSTVAQASMGTTSITFAPDINANTGNGDYLTNFGNNNSNNVERDFYVVVDISPSVTASTPSITASVANTGLVVSAGSIGAGSETGNAYAFTTLEANFTQATDDGTGTANQDDVDLLAFSVNSNGTQGLVSPIVFTFDVNVTDVLENFDFKVAGVNIGGTETYTLNGAGTQLTIAGFDPVDVSDATSFLLEADIKTIVNNGSDFTVTLAPAGTTVDRGYPENFGPYNNAIDITGYLADFTQNADGATAIAGNTDINLLAFNVNSGGDQSIASPLIFTFNTDVTNILENFDLQVGGVNIGGVETYTLNGAGTQLTIAGFTAVDVTNSTDFTLLADIKPAATSANDFTTSLAPAGVAVSHGNVENFTTYTNTIDVTAAQVDFTQNADAGTATATNTDINILAFNANSNGIQSLTSPLVFTFNTDVSGILENFDLQVGGVNIGGTETYTLNGAGTQLTIAAFTATDVTNATDFTLLADVKSTATSSNDFTVSLAPSGITVNHGTVEAFGTFSNSVDITALVADFTQNVDDATAAASATDINILAFNVNSNGVQTLTAPLVITFNTDVTNILENFDLQVGGVNIGGSETYTLNGAGTQLTIAAFTATDVTNSTDFTLFADVKVGATTDFTVSLAPAGATVNIGTVETFTTFTNSVDVISLEADFTQNADASTAIGSNADVTLIAFNVNSNGTQSIVSPITITFNTDVSAILENFDLQIGGINVAGAEMYTLDGTGTQLTIAAFTAVDVTNSTDFSLLADIKAGVTSGSDFTITLAPTDITLNQGAKEAFGSFTNSIDLTALEADFIQGAGDVTAIGDENDVTLLAFDINSNGTQSLVAPLVLTFNTDVTNILENFDLQVGGLNIAGSETYTLDGSGTQLTIAAFDAVDVANLTSLALLADIKVAATSSNDFTISLAPAGTDVDQGNIEVFTTFTNSVDITALEADFTQDADAATALGDQDDVTLLAFTVNSNGVQSLNTPLVITFNTNVTNILENFDLQVGGINIGGVETYTLDGTGTQLTIAGFTAVDVTNATAFSLLADIKSAATSANDFVITLAPAGITPAQGVVEAFTPFTNAVDVTALEADFTQNVDASTAVGDQNDVTLLAFSVNSNGTQSLTTPLTFVFNTDVTNILENFDLQVGGVNIGGAETYTLDGTGTQLTIAAFNAVDVTNATSFSLLADIRSTVTSANDFAISLTPAGVTVNSGYAEAFGIFGNTIDITELTATLTQVSATPVIAGTILEAGSNNVVLTGFSVTTSGNQTLNDVTFGLTNTAGKLSGFELFRSTTAGTLGASISTNASANFTGLAEALSSGTTYYYYLVADVNASLTTATATADVFTSQATIVFAAGNKTAVSFGRTFSFTQSASTTVTKVATSEEGSFDFTEYDVHTATSGLTDGGTDNLVTLSIQDNDSDNLHTFITSITFTMNHTASVARLALFDAANNNLAEANPGASVTFTLLTPYQVTDNTTAQLRIRATFAATVTDNVNIELAITGVGVDNTKSLLGTFTTINTDPARNEIDVDATEMRFDPTTLTVSPAPTPFSFTVNATDGNGNIDLDVNDATSNNDEVTISRTVGGGTFSAGADGATRPFVNGSVSWTTVTLTPAGTYTLRADHQGSFANKDISVEVVSLGVDITGPLNQNFCIGGIFATLDPIKLKETDPQDFVPGSGLTYSIILPTNFVFNTAITPTLAKTSDGSDNITGFGATSYPSSNIFRFTYSATGSDEMDEIIISNLQVRYTGTTDAVAAPILRVGGSAIQVKNSDTDAEPHGFIRASAGTPPVGFGFIVDELPGNLAVSDNETNFNQNDAPVKLIGTPSGGIFTGNGVSLVGAEYRFTPSAVGTGTHVITYTYTDGTPSQCKHVFTKNFRVTTSLIQNLQLEYCSNDPTATGLEVDQADIDAYFGRTGLTIVEFVYWNPFIGQISNGSLGPDNTLQPTDLNARFKPNDPKYEESYNYYSTTFQGRGVYIGYTATDGSSTYIVWQFVKVFLSPTVTFNVAKKQFCEDETPIELIGSPRHSTNTANDYFTNIAPVFYNSGTNTWNFSPTAAGAGSSTQSFDITYRYTDPGTGCADTSAVQTLFVHPRPSEVPTSDIISAVSSGTPTVFACKDSNPGIFGAQFYANTTYRWYSDNLLTNEVKTGITFDPRNNIDNTAVGTTAFYVTRTINGCESSDDPLTINVIVNPPATVEAGTNTSVCNGDVISLGSFSPTPTFGGAASSATWSIDGGVTGDFLDASDNPVTAPFPLGTAVKYVPSSTDLQNGSIVFRLTTDDPGGVSNPCKAVEDFVIITINSVAQANAGTDKIVCAGDKIELNGTIGGAASSLTWYKNTVQPANQQSTSNSFQYLPTPDELNNGASIDFILQTDNPAGPCEAAQSTITVDIHKRATVLAGTDLTKCVNNTIVMSGSIPSTSSADPSLITWSSNGTGTFSPNSNTLNAHYIPSASEMLSGNENITLTLTSNDPDGPAPESCPVETSSIRLTLRPIPEAPLNTSAKTVYCRNDAPVNFSAQGTISGSELKWYKEPALTTVRGTGTTFTFDESTNAVKNVPYYVTQTAYIDGSISFAGCQSPATQIDLVVNPLPVPNFSEANRCIGDAMEFTDASIIASGSVVNWGWSFGNAQRFEPSTGTIAGEDTHGGRTAGTYQNPTHKYEAIGSYNVKLVAESDLGCRDEVTKIVEIGPLPIAEFSFRKLCFEDATAFDAAPSPGDAIIGFQREWTFDDPASPNNTSGLDGPEHTFTAVGTYNVNLKLTTNLGCTDEITKPVSVLPYIKSDSYSQDFDLPGHGWVSEGIVMETNGITNSFTSWQLTTPNGNNINNAVSGPNAWFTRVDALNTYANNERSVLNGPCFDMSMIQRPVLSFSYWNNTDFGNDGVYLEISKDNGQTWKELGALNEGQNWYNRGAILGLSPLSGIGQPIGQIGWSGNTETIENPDGWTEARIALDQYRTENKVRIRFVFGSNGDNPRPEDVTLDGFAMDNFSIRTRNRTILAENFTNLSDASAATTNNTAFRNFRNELTTDEIVRVQYHTSIGGSDAIHDANKVDPNARAAFYGITSPFRGYIDGETRGTFNPPMEASNLFSSRSLVVSPVDIVIDPPTVDAQGQFTIRTRVTTLEDINSLLQPVIHVAVVEKKVGSEEFVLRKLLPSAAGTPMTVFTFDESTNTGATQEVVVKNDLRNIENMNQVAIVVFVQSLQNRSVLQTRFFGNVPVPDVVTGIETPGNTFSIYPNPADKEVTIELPAPVMQHTTLRMYDQLGKVVNEASFERGDSKKTLGTESLSGGVYLIQIDTQKGVLRKKLMVVQRN